MYYKKWLIYPIVLISTFLLTLCSVSPAEKELQSTLNEMKNTVNELDKILHSQYADVQLKQQKAMAIVGKVSGLFDKWVEAYSNALTEIPDEKLDHYSREWDKIIKKFSDISKSQ